MKNSHWKLGALALSGALVIGGFARAEDNAPGDMDNPPPRRGDRRDDARRGGNRPDRPDNMTPEQRRQQRIMNVTRMLKSAGVDDEATQDAVADYLGEQQDAQRDLQDKARAVSEALRTEAVTDAQLATLLADFRVAANAEKTRRQTAAKTLDEKIGYTKKPRLEAILTLTGIVGDEAGLLGEQGGRGMGRPGMGGPGMGRPGMGGPGMDGPRDGQRGGRDGRRDGERDGRRGGRPGGPRDNRDDNGPPPPEDNNE